jgi:hypothetical protein
VSQPELFSERAIILAPNGRDGQIATRILKEAGFPVEIRADLLAVCEELDKGAGLAIIATRRFAMWICGRSRLF